MSRVVLIRCSDYDQHRVNDAVQRAIEVLGGARAFFHSGQKVLLKPNLLSARTPDQGVTTRTEVIRGLLSLIKPLGLAISLGDSPAGQVAGIERLWQRTGMTELCASEGITPLSFEKAGAKKIPLNLPPLTEVPITMPILNTDVLVNLPKIKTHSGTLFTGAIKNCFGCIPGLAKVNMHRIFTKPEPFARLLVEVYRLVKPNLHLADGIVAMHGNGPATGPLFNLGVILASTDGVALDSIAASLFGFDPLKIPAIRIATELGLGVADREQIDLLGDEPPQVPKLQLPMAFWQSTVPEFIMRWGSSLATIRPCINKKSCRNCRSCQEACPMGAIKEIRGRLVIDSKVCITCLCCHEMCEHGAVDFTGSLPVRFYLWRYKRKHSKKKAQSQTDIR